MKAPKSVERGILELMEDGIGFAVDAEQTKLVDAEAPFSRASLLSTFLLLEAVANACLESMSVRGGFSDDLDRLPTLSKFDLFLTVGLKKRQLDRGRKEIQAIQDLKRLRDSFVHPRKQHIIWEKWNPKGESISASPSTPILGLSKIPSYCHLQDAVKGLRAAHGFFSYYFRRRCGFSRKKVSSLLISEDPKQRASTFMTPMLDRRMKHWLNKHDVPFDYFRVIWGDYADLPVWGLPNLALERPAAP